MVEAPPAIELHGVGKRYRLERERTGLRSSVPFARAHRSELWALRDIDLHIDDHETVGILGHNGAGKTTLLRLLAGVTRPSAGRLRIRGRIAPLIGVGVGFHGEMSGRENVYINGMLLGLTRAEIDKRFDSIVEFSELVGVLDTPTKFYSSGMMVRLAFAVGMHVGPQVLLVDEVLAVGDVAFQRKCLDRMQLLQQQGTTIVLVSHSVHAIRLLCPRALVFDHGRLVFDGPCEQAVATHHRLLAGAPTNTAASDQAAVIANARLEDRNGSSPHELRLGETYRLLADITFAKSVPAASVRVQVIAETGATAYEVATTVSDRVISAGATMTADLEFVAQLGDGRFRLRVCVLAGDGTLLSAPQEVIAYRPGVVGSYGIAELAASIDVGGHVVTEHRPIGVEPQR